MTPGSSRSRWSEVNQVAQRGLHVAQRLSSWGLVTFHFPGTTGDREVCANEVNFPYNYSSLQKAPHLIISVIFKKKNIFFLKAETNKMHFSKPVGPVRYQLQGV